MTLVGVFMALDLLLFAVFWELVIIPMFFLIGIWGGPNRRYAALKFLIFTQTGFVIMLLSIFALYFNSAGVNAAVYRTNANTLDMTAFLHGALRHETGTLASYLTVGLQIPMFAAFLVGFLVKLPSFPFHTWLPDAHVEAPTGGSVLLAGVLLKIDRKSTRLNSSHVKISYAVFCLKKKKRWRRASRPYGLSST